MRREFDTRGYYTEGNAARQLEVMPAMPDYREEIKKRKLAEEQAESKRQKRVARVQQERALRANRRYAIFLTMGAVIFAIFAGAFINIQSENTTRMKKIASLESQIANLKAENDEAVKRINTAIDLDAIKTTALDELGMFYATEEQIVYYTVEKDDYMNQYIEIPME